MSTSTAPPRIGDAPAAARRPHASLVRRLLGRVVAAGEARERITVAAPFTGESIAEIPRCTTADVAAAFRLARAAQPAWWAKSHAARRRVFLRFHDLLLARQEEVLDLIQLEAGKARRHAFEEVMDAAVVSRHYALRAERYLRPQRRRGALPGLTVTRELRHPVGVVGCIVPWNYPLNLSITDASRRRSSPATRWCSSRIIRLPSPRSGPSIS
jgi:succinate-semialdehyde dehydrogenase / glutarate-semialdehyde dehydrogenase